MSAVAAPPDRRFRRAHVKPTRRRRATRRFAAALLGYCAAAAAAGYALYRGSIGVAHARVLEIDRITITGNARLSAGEVLGLLAGLRGENVLRADLDRWRRRLLASPWVRDAALRRALPSAVDVTIVERQPAMTARVNGEMYLVDDRGVIIDQYGPQYADFDMPIVDGLAAPGVQGAMTDEARALLAARVIASLKGAPEIAARVSQIDVSDLHNATVMLSGDEAVLELGEDLFLARLQAYTDVRSAIRERMIDIDAVDLRFDDRIYVRPGPRASAAGRMTKAATAREAGGRPRRSTRRHL
jgi:cell division protein FtsQ